jgi:hypothetical protein
VLKVTCNAAPGSIRADLSGRNFVAVLGTAQTPLEALQLKRKIMGPSWLSLSNAVKEEAQNHLSWCKVCCSGLPMTLLSSRGLQACLLMPALFCFVLFCFVLACRAIMTGVCCCTCAFMIMMNLM